jgi:hypothetical protein
MVSICDQAPHTSTCQIMNKSWLVNQSGINLTKELKLDSKYNKSTGKSQYPVHKTFD